MLNEIPASNDKRLRLQKKRWFPSEFNIDAILEHALSIAQRKENCTSALISDWQLGSDSFIIRISFNNNCHQDLIAKSPLKHNDVQTRLIVESEVETMKLVEDRTKIPVPHVYRHASAVSDNPVRWPYILMSTARGIQLDWDDTPPEGRESVMMGLAKCARDLSRLSFDQIGSLIRVNGSDIVPTRSLHRSLSKISAGPFRSSREYFKAQLQQFHEDVNAPTNSSRVPFLREIPHRDNFKSVEDYLAADRTYNDTAVHGANDWDTAQNIACYKRLYEELKESLQVLVNLDAPEYMLAHPDLNSSNIFIDPSTYEITCIIDWERASTVPMESFYVVPHLPDPRGPLDDRLRDVYIQAFEHFAEEKGNQDPLPLLRDSEIMWAFDKLIQRDAGTYFHYAVSVFLTWKLGEGWRSAFTSMCNGSEEDKT